MPVLHLNEESFHKLAEADQLTLVDFWATWCGPCRMLAPTVEELARQYEGKAAVAKLDVDENQELAIRYGVMSIPTVILFRKGEELGRLVGLMPIDNYRELIDKNL